MDAIMRWNLHHRLQHGFLALSMIGLMGTGFPIKYTHTAWGPAVIQFFGGFRATLVIHKVSAVMLCLAAVWHAAYLVWGMRRYGPSRAMLPGPRDVKDSLEHALFLLGLRDHPPRYGRYSYLEKFEYLAVFWGLVVMGLSGMALWFPVLAGTVIPRWGLDALRVVHSNEAFVAMLSLLFGHFFFAHFSPTIFPTSTVWLTGKISLTNMAEEHPLELQELVERGVVRAEDAAEAAQAHGLRLQGWRRLVGGVELVLYSAIFYWLLVTFIPLLLS